MKAHRRTAFPALVAASLASCLAAGMACGGANSSDGAGGPAGGATPAAPDAAGAETGTGAADAATPDAAPTCSPDVKTDSKNCGSCGHECLGSPCLEGRCVPVVVVGSQDLPAAIALDATHVFWQSQKNGFVFRVPKAGGAPELLTPGAGDYQVSARPHVYVDATHVYYTNNDKQAVQRVLKTGAPGGSTSEVVVSLINQVPTFTADADNVYVGAGSFYASATLYRTAKVAPGTSTAMGDVFGLVSLAVDDTRLYWTEIEGATTATSGSVRAISKTSGADAGAPTVFADKQGNPNSVTVTGAQLYWGNADTGAVKTVPKAGGTAVSLATAQFQPVSIATDATNIYWINAGSGDVMTCPLSGCSAGPRALAVGQATPTSLAVDDTAIYWTAKTGGAVMKVAK